MEAKIKSIESTFLSQIKSAQSLTEIDKIYLALFGKNGQITLLPKKFPSLPEAELKNIGPVFNATKSKLEQAIEKKRQEIRETNYDDLKKEKLDLENTGIKKRSGHLHPLTKFEIEVVELFRKLGFQLFEATHIDSDYNNFESLNIPRDHPARDLWDTMYVDQPPAVNPKAKTSNLLLRTHTTNAQIKIMEQFKPPIRMMVLDRCFRYENLDARHEHTFEQFDLVYIDRNLSMAHLQYLAEYFLQNIFGKDIKVRMRPKYYPFVEPGVGIDGLCIFCKGKGCKICGGVGWLELAGAGMIHPKVLENGGINSKEYSGIAWGMGPGRMAMLKYGINDLRVFNSGDIKSIYGGKK